MALYNKYDKETLRKRLEAEDFSRTTVSFYRYVYLDEVDELRNTMYESFENFGVLGRIYLAREGINAQISIPDPQWDAFLNHLNAQEPFREMPMKIAVEDDGKSFLKLIIRVRKNIVADGLEDDEYDVTDVGKHLNAEEFNDAMNSPDTVVVDMRNHYESEVGHFIGAVLPPVDTFRDELPFVVDLLKDKKDKKVLLYCTGGIRCEKASAYLKHEGFEDVNQLHGGIIDYSRQVKDQGLESKFIGKNFVFDERLGERITEDIISRCHQCGELSDTHTNCANDACHLLFIQCKKCAEEFQGACSPDCFDFIQLPIDKQRELRKGERKMHGHNVFKSRLRPNLKEIIASQKEGAIRMASSQELKK